MSWVLLNFDCNINFDGSNFTSWKGHHFHYYIMEIDDKNCKKDTLGYCRWCIMDFIISRLVKKIQSQFRYFKENERKYKNFHYLRNREIKNYK